ncbi:hypothetical protein H2201_008534 [Coniosporium apollinis]|uniref:Uncharacterized protein n=1 Tax=Coniosporium apollinis TaxID=61459 RepID=A0ABQ9NHX2_9PEZI|nr:hypothetical protein H2201_008534 [Coniosporium apollinis]
MHQQRQAKTFKMCHLARFFTLATFATAVRGLLNITVPEFVNAGTSVKIQIETDLDLGAESSHVAFDSIHIFLSATTHDGRISGPICLLADDIPINIAGLTVPVPASVGPPGSFYYLKATPFVNTWNADFEEWALEHSTSVSNYFILANATSQWAQFELDGRSRRWHTEYIPCNIYDCTRQAIDEYYDDHPAHLDDEAVGEIVHDSIRYLAGRDNSITGIITAAPIAVSSEIATDIITTTTSATHVVPRAAQTPSQNTTGVLTTNTTLGYATPPHPIAAPTRPASEGARAVSRWCIILTSFAIGQLAATG